MRKYPVITKINNESQVMFAGLMSLCLLCLSILVGSSETSAAISLGIYCFAVAIPSLAFCTERVRIDKQYQYRTHSDWIDLVEAAGIFGALLGFTAVFWHVSILVAAVFVVSCFAANALLVWYSDAMAELNGEADIEADIEADGVANAQSTKVAQSEKSTL